MPHVSRFRLPWMAALSLLAWLAAPSLHAQGSFPSSVAYQGQARGAKGQPLEGRFEIEVRVFDRQGQEELWRERFAQVEVRGGEFTIELGSGRVAEDGPRRFASLQAVFQANYEVQLDLSFGGQRFGPRVGLLPAGHSLESRMIIDGQRQPDDGQKHWRWYSHPTDVSSFQATILTPAAAGQQRSQGPATRSGAFLLPMEGPWISRAVRELPLASEANETVGEGEVGAEEERSGVREVKGATELNPPRHESLVDAQGRPFGTVGSKAPDPLVELAQRAARRGTRTPSLGVSFDGVNNISGFYPPDTEMAVGPNHIVQVTNVSFAIYSKTGSLLSGPVLTNTLWSGLPSGDVCRTRNDGDAIFLYDRQADRFVLTQFAVPGSGQKVCFAVSQTPDPTGAYFLYTLSSQRFPDYFKLGVWPDATHNAYFMGTNSGNQNQYDVYALDRANMLAGASARAAQFFQSFPNLLVPADTDSVAAPPAGSPGIFYSFRDGGEPYFGSPATDSLDLREFSVNWTTPASSTFNLVQSLTPASGLVPFNWTVCGFFASNCLPQPGTAVKIDSASWWPMQRLAYRNFNGRQTLVGTWTVDTLASGDHAAPRWFELRRGSQTSGNWSFHQQGTQAPDGAHRWMGSIAMDSSGDVALGYSVVDATASLFPSIRYATRLPTEDPGTLQAEATLQAGSGSQTGPDGRWGDYSSMEIDPSDNCTFWYTTEYLTTTGSAPWKTRIASFKLPECGVPNFSIDVPSPAAVACSPGSASYPIEGWYYAGLTGNVTLSASGNPPGTSVSFTTNPLTPGSLTSTMTVNGITAANAGLSTITLTGTGGGGSLVHSRTLTLTVDAPPAPTLQSPADGATVAANPPTLQWASVPGATGYTIEVASDPAFANIVATASVGATTLSYAPVSSLAANSLSWWRVRATNVCGAGSFSAPFTFRTNASLCRNPNLAIPDGNSTGVTDNLVTSAVGTLSDLNVSIVAPHTWVGDLVFSLTKGATTATLMNRPGGTNCSADNVDATLDDEGGAGAVGSACPPTGGLSYTPTSPLSAFDSQSLAGTWTLTAKDLVGQDVGTVVQWCLVPTIPAVAPTVSTPTSSAITASTATLGGAVTGDGGSAITERGVVYAATSVNGDPTIGGAGVTKVATSGTLGVFTVPVSGLLPGTGYSYKAYAINAVGTSYTSPASTFTTLANPPTVTTPTAGSIAASTATLGGTVASDGGSPITERGVVYAPTATNGDPTIGGTGVLQATTGGTTGVFTVPVSGLLASTGYSYKAYATNAVGTTYTSPASTFSTTSATSQIFNVGPTSASGPALIFWTAVNVTGNVEVWARPWPSGAWVLVQTVAATAGTTSVTYDFGTGGLQTELWVGANGGQIVGSAINTAPGTPSIANVGPTTASGNAPITWTAVGVSSVDVWARPLPGGAWVLVQTVAASAGTTSVNYNFGTSGQQTELWVGSSSGGVAATAVNTASGTPSITNVQPTGASGTSLITWTAAGVSGNVEVWARPYPAGSWVLVETLPAAAGTTTVGYAFGSGGQQTELWVGANGGQVVGSAINTAP